MKKVIIYISLLIVGLLLGYWLFNSSESTSAEEIHDPSTHAEQMWTCSMHPQIMQPDPGQCPICGMDLIPAKGGGEGLAADQFKLSENAMALANVETMTVGGNDVEDAHLNLSGKIQINEKAIGVQVAYFAGRLEELKVNFTGEQVNRGDLLAMVYSPELVAAQQELITAASMKDKQPELYQAVRNKLKLWKLTENQIAAIEKSGKIRKNFPVYATVSGTVTEKLVQEGDYVKEGQPLFEIVNLNTVWAVFDAYENQIRNIESGEKIKITTNAYPGKTFEAEVSFIDPVLNTSRRTVLVRAELENKEGKLKPGMFVRGELQKNGPGDEEETIIIPKSAVLWTGERSLVYVKPDPSEPVFEMREVKLGNVLENSFQVLEGLSKGEEIVVNGTFTVDAAAQLKGKRSMMTPEKESTSDSTTMEMELSENFKEQFLKVFKGYFELKDAFVSSDAILVTAKTREVLAEVRELSSEKLGPVESALVTELEEILNIISSSRDLQGQREQFIQLSEIMISFASNMEGINSPLYVQHCPMADANKGAEWLSLTQDIRNPYFGESMMTCGDVVRTID